MRPARYFFVIQLSNSRIGQLLLRHPSGLPRPLDGEPYIVKIKSSVISLNLHNIT